MPIIERKPQLITKTQRLLDIKTKNTGQRNAYIFLHNYVQLKANQRIVTQVTA